eukprot:1502694-Rhodomonas_salina.2
MQPHSGKGSGGGGGGGGGSGGGRCGGPGKNKSKGGRVGRASGTHCPNSSEIVKGAAWAFNKRLSCNKCSDQFHHEYFECPVVFAENNPGHNMPGWIVQNGKPVHAPGMWNADGTINDAC